MKILFRDLFKFLTQHLSEGVTVRDNVMPAIEGHGVPQVEVRPVPEASIRVRHTLPAQEATLIQPRILSAKQV